MGVTKIAGAQVEVDIPTRTLDELWEERGKALEAEEISYKHWEEKMDDPFRLAVEDICRQILGVMQQDMSWLPFAFRVVEGACIDVTFRIAHSTIADAVLERRTNELKELQAAKEGSAAELEDIRATSGS